MAREIYSQDLGGARVSLVVPDNATKEDEIDIIVHHIKYYKRKAETIRAALETLKEIAEDDENIEALLTEEQFANALDTRAQVYEAISIGLVQFLLERSDAEELIKIVGPLMFGDSVLIKKTLPLLEGLMKGENTGGGEHEQDD